MYDDIFAFVKLVEIGTYSRTAEILKTTQSTLTRRIKSLEEELGVTLIERDLRSVLKLTAEGTILYQDFRDQNATMDIILNEVLNHNKDLHGTLKVALPSYLATGIISSHIARFAKNRPGIKLSINYTQKPIHLIKNNLDLAVSVKMPTSQTCKVKLLKKFDLLLYASQEYINKFGNPATPQELEQHNLIGMLDINDEIRSHYIAKNRVTGEETFLNVDTQINISPANLHAYQIAISGDFIFPCFNSHFIENLSIPMIPILPDYSFGEVPCYLIKSSGIQNKLEKEFTTFIEKCFAKNK